MLFRFSFFIFEVLACIFRIPYHAQNICTIIGRAIVFVLEAQGLVRNFFFIFILLTIFQNGMGRVADHLENSSLPASTTAVERVTAAIQLDTESFSFKVQRLEPCDFRIE